jgi:thymidine kinase
MFSGKTARLIGLLQAAAAAGRRVLAVKHAIDDRYDASHLATHDGRRFPAASARNAAEVMRLAAGDDAVACREAAVVEPAGRSARRIPFDVIGVDEAHFFGDELTDVCRALVRHGRSVIAVGLHHDAWGRPFAPLPALIELADVVTLLQAPCTGCGAPAEYSQRMTPVTDPLMIGGPEAYQARCAGCFVPLAPPRAGSTRPAAWPVSPSVGLPSGRSHGKNQ